MKSGFVSKVSHELRTPLTSLCAWPTGPPRPESSWALDPERDALVRRGDVERRSSGSRTLWRSELLDRLALARAMRHQRSDQPARCTLGDVGGALRAHFRAAGAASVA